MDPALHELFQSFGFLVGTFWLYRFIKVRHETWITELRAFRTPELTRGEREHLDVKVVTDRRLGRLGYGSIWCDHPGAGHNCTLCKLNRQNAPEPTWAREVPLPDPIYPDGPRRHVEPLVPPPPPTSIPGR